MDNQPPLNIPAAQSDASSAKQSALSPDNRERESQAIDLLRFFCVLFIIPLHCCFSHKVPIPPCDLVRTVERFFCSFPSLNVLLFLSGFLFFRSVPTNWQFFSVLKKKLWRRISSLLVPYLLWTAVTFAANCMFRTFPEGMEPSRPIDILRWIVGWDGWISHPGGFGLWYIKSLFLAALLAPLYWFAFRLLGPTSILIGIFLCTHPPTPIDYPLFSSPYFLGGALAFEKISLEDLSKRTYRLFPVAGLAFAGWMFCKGINIKLPDFLAAIPYFFSIVLFSVCCHPKTKISAWLTEITRSSTFVYFAHFFVSRAVGSALQFAIPLNSGRAAAAAYIIRVAGTVVLSISLFFAIRKLTPGIMSALTGNRSRTKRRSEHST